MVFVNLRLVFGRLDFAAIGLSSRAAKETRRTTRPQRRAGRPERAYFALVCDPASLPRLDEMEALRKLASPTLSTPLDCDARHFMSTVHQPTLERRRLDRLLQLFKGAHLDLPDTLARDAVFLRQILERGRLLA
jgi:hypothetical protein